MLSESGVVGYSERERRLFEALPKDGGRVNTLDLAKSLFGDEEVLNARQLVMVAMRALQTKARINQERFDIRNSERAGPHPIEFWVEPRA